MAFCRPATWSSRTRPAVGASRRYEPSYTSRVKTAVSIPDPVFAAAEELADRLGVSRSQLYTRALSDLLEQRREDWVTEELDRIYARQPSTLEPALARLQSASLPKDDW